MSQRLMLVDCARALAAFAVLFWHYQMFFWDPGSVTSPANLAAREPLHALFAVFYDGGAYAVPIFWVISGFVFSRVYVGQDVSTRDFITNRLARLYPLHFLTLMVMMILQAITVAEFGTWFAYGHNDALHFALQLGFASNWLSHDFSFNGPVWSVSVEVLIYAVFWAAHRSMTRFGASLPAIFALIFLQLWRMDGGNWIAQCGFCFFVGVSLDIAHRLSQSRARVLAVGMVAAGLTMIYFGRIPLGIPPLFGGILIALVEIDSLIPSRWAPALMAIGDNTYGMYLWHVPLMTVAFIIFGTALGSAAESPWLLLGFVATVVVAARISFVGFERPMRQGIRRWAVPRAPVVLLGVAAPEATIARRLSPGTKTSNGEQKAPADLW